MAVKLGELPQAELLGARVAGEGSRFERSLDALDGRHRAQIIPQRLPLLREAALEEFEEVRLVPDSEACQLRSLTGRAHPDQRGSDSRPRPERGRWNPQENLRPHIELRDGGKIAVVAPAGPRHEPRGDFELNDDGHEVNFLRVLEEPVENGRSDVVGQVAIDFEAPASQSHKVELEDISRDDFDVRNFACELAQPFEQLQIELDGDHTPRNPRQFARHFTVPGTDFDPDVFPTWAERAQDVLPQGSVDEKMLSQSLPGHRRRRV